MHGEPLPGMPGNPELLDSQFENDKVVIEASYDETGLWNLAIRMNHEGLRDDIVPTILALLDGSFRIPRGDPPRTGVVTTTNPNGGLWYNANTRRRVPGEKATEIIPRGPGDGIRQHSP